MPTDPMLRRQQGQATAPPAHAPSINTLASQPLILVCAAILMLLPAPGARAQEAIFSDGFEMGLPGGWSAVVGLIPPEAFRATDIDLRDPHVFVDGSILGCIDFTDNAALGLVPSFNQQLESGITTDSDGDGLLDISLLLLLRPLDQSGTGLNLETRSGLCSAPMATTTCEPDLTQAPANASYDTQAAGVCLEPEGGTTSGYSPGIIDPPAPCFASMAADVVLHLDDLEIPLSQARTGATFVGDPADQLHSGLVLGFLAESVADATLIPAGLPIIGGQPLSSVLPGGTGCCAPHDDRDTLGPVSGWWLYFNIEATTVPYSGP